MQLIWLVLQLFVWIWCVGTFTVPCNTPICCQIHPIPISCCYLVNLVQIIITFMIADRFSIAVLLHGPWAPLCRAISSQISSSSSSNWLLHSCQWPNRSQGVWRRDCFHPQSLLLQNQEMRSHPQYQPLLPAIFPRGWFSTDSPSLTKLETTVA